MGKRLSGAIRPTLPKRPTLPVAPKLKARKNIAQTKRPAVPKPTKAAPKGKVTNAVQGLSQAMDIHSHIADAAINTHNLVTPGATVVAHAIQKSTGLNNLSALSSGSGIHHKVQH